MRLMLVTNLSLDFSLDILKVKTESPLGLPKYIVWW